MEFRAWPKTARLYRDIVITEKIDGTNAGIHIVPWDYPATPIATDPQVLNHVAVLDGIREGEDGLEDNEDYTWYLVGAQSRSRMLEADGPDNHGFAEWVADNAFTLVEDLGPGLHMGEWWGKGIQRGYGMNRKVFSLFNTAKWAFTDFITPDLYVVPILYQGVFAPVEIHWQSAMLRDGGSQAAPGFMKPEGICIYHTALRKVLKYTLDDDGHKG